MRLIILAVLGLGLLLSSQANPKPSPQGNASPVGAASRRDNSYPQGNGKLSLYNYHLNESIEVIFRKDGIIDKEAINKINHLLRSRDNAEITPIDGCLIDLIDHLQDHFNADTIEIISGYRSKEFNTQLLHTGHSVSPVSLHTKGQALDIHIDEITEERLRDYLLDLKLGGVGYYGPLDFVHIDTGPARRWGEDATFPRKLIGVLNPKHPVQLTSDKNDYFKNDTLQLLWKTSKGFDLKNIVKVKLEHFKRGKWITLQEDSEWLPRIKSGAGYPRNDERMISLPVKTILDFEGRYGKYRVTFKMKASDELLSSNEFYLKQHE